MIGKLQNRKGPKRTKNPSTLGLRRLRRRLASADHEIATVEEVAGKPAPIQAPTKAVPVEAENSAALAGVKRNSLWENKVPLAPEFLGDAVLVFEEP